MGNEAMEWHRRAGCQRIEIKSSLDGTQQESFFLRAGGGNPAPLLVSLHTWSFTAESQDSSIRVDWCRKMNWSFIQPNFRGPNWTPQAMGSPFAVRDIIDAVDYAKRSANVDTDRIYLVGCSGGGHMALLLAGLYPQMWAAVSAWASIFDIAEWHRFQKSVKGGYWEHIEKSAGGDPSKSPEVAKECASRSSMSCLASFRGLNLDVGTGIHDGYTGSVPTAHTLRAFNAVANESDIIKPDEIDYFVKEQATPPALAGEWDDKAYSRKIHFRRISGNARVTIFEGGHEEISSASLPWLALQRKGVPAVWSYLDKEGFGKRDAVVITG